MIVFQFEESLQRGMSSLMLLALSVCFKRGLLGLLYLLESANKHLGCRALVRHVQDMGNAWTWQYMCPRFFFFFWVKNDGHGWDMACATPKKKKTVTHFLSHQSPPTSSHTDLLCRQSSSHSNLFFFFFFSSIYFSFVVSPFALILVLFLFTFFFFFPASHYHTCRALFYFQPPTWTKDV